MGSIYISGNLYFHHPTDLENILFYGAINLRRAVLANNQIVKIGGDTFKKMTLKPVTTFDNTFQRKLEEIDLSDNQLTDLEYETFSQLSSLKILLLKCNNIRLKYGIFPLLLKKLDLSHNQLKNFTLHQLVNSQLLEELKLNGNQLSGQSVEFIFPEALLQLMHIYRFEISDCFSCMQLADLLAYFKRINRNIIVQFDSEKINAPNIFGVACFDDAERQN